MMKTAYEYPAYEYLISCFHKFSQTLSQVLMPVDKLK